MIQIQRKKKLKKKLFFVKPIDSSLRLESKNEIIMMAKLTSINLNIINQFSNCFDYIAIGKAKYVNLYLLNEFTNIQ